MDIKKIVITGGPCAGKSTTMERIGETFKAKGYTVLFVWETATELITGGVTPWTCSTNAKYQEFQMRLQKDKELIFEQAAKTMDAEKVLIVCDRGMLDNKAYMSEEEFTKVVKVFNSTETKLRNDYDAVFHLVTAAKGAEEYYITSNNSARTETVEEAAVLDNRLIEVWREHPYFRIIDNSSSFDDKINRLIKEISIFLDAENS